MKLNNPYQTVIEAANHWQQPIAYIIQAAGNDQFPVFTIADHWPVEKNGSERSIDGWVQLDKQEVMKAIIKDHVIVTRVRKDKMWFRLQESIEIRFGALFVEKEIQDIESEPSQLMEQAPNQAESWMTVKEAAAYLNLAPNTLDKHRSNGTGPEYTTVGSRSIRYRKSALDSWST